ncbi:MAG: DegV family protein [Chloroflexi bacterium]|nr:DegV family protein [Chloroflexota bacterium]
MNDRKQKVRIVTDSASQIDMAWAHDNHVAVLAQQVTIDGHTYREGIDLSDDELAEKMITAPPDLWPRIQPPTVEEFSNTYRQLLRETSEIISLHVSSRLSDTIRNARLAADEYRGRCNITVLDSQSVGLGLNILVRKVSQFANENVPSEMIVRYTRGVVKHIYGAFIAEDLQYMAHSGCLRPAQAVLGKMLGVIPFLTIEEGEIVAIEKVRSVDRAVEKLVEFAAEFEHPEELAILQLSPHSDEKTANLMSMLKLTFPKIHELPVRNCGATIGCIIGPTGIGVMIYEGK